MQNVDFYPTLKALHYVNAMKYYNQLIVDYPHHPKVVDAVFQIASLYFIQEKYTQAEQHYLRILNEFNNPVKKKEALAALKDVYTALNQPNKYIDLVEGSGTTITVNEKDTLLYFNAFQQYEDSLYQQAIVAFDNYLKEFSTPTFYTEAHYYKGTAHYRLKEYENCHEHYKAVLSKPTSIYTEFASLIASQYEYDAKNYNDAIGYYEQLELTTTYPENKLLAQIGLMRCHTFNDRFDLAKLYANKVLLSPLSLDNVTVESHYVLGKADMEVANYDQAIAHFREVTEGTKGSIGAESQFNIALIFNLKEEYRTSEDEVRVLMKEQAGYDYWVAKALILQAKNSIGLEDYVQAEYTLNSVLSGYSIADDGIIDEANEVMHVLQGLKNKTKEIPQGGENIIEIGGDND